MRIILAAGIYPPDIGGPATYAQELARFLIARGHTVSILCFSSSDTPSTSDLAVIRINRSRGKFIGYLQYLWKLLRLAPHSDLIYAMGPIAGGLQGFIASRIFKKPFVVKVTGDYVWEQARTKYKLAIGIDDFQTYSDPLPFQLRVMHHIERAVVRGARSVIVPSKYLAALVAGWNVDAKSIRIIYNASVFPVSKPSSSSTERTGLNVLSVGRLVPWKGFDDLISAWLNVQKKFPQATLTIIGDGPEEESLSNLIDRLHLGSSIALKGKIDQDKMPIYYDAARVFVLNSGYEGLSHTVLEAQSRGLACALSAVGGNSELVTDRVNGLLFRYKDTDAITNSIIALLSDTDSAERYIQESYTRLERYRPEKTLAETESFLMEILKK